MSAVTAFILSLLAAVAGWFLSMVMHTWDIMTTLTIIVMGTCIIYTINHKRSDSQ